MTPISETLHIDGCAVCSRIVRPSADAAFDPGLPVLLLHGLGCSGDAWKPVLALLQTRGCTQTVAAPDLPGYGGSECDTHALSMDALADWVARFLEQSGLARVHVAGHSMGCQVALALARRHPKRVGGLVLVGPTTGRRLVPLWRYAAGLIADGFCESPAYNKTLAHMYFEMGLVRYFATVRRMMQDDPIGQAGQTDAPCLIVRGVHDKVIPLHAARRLAKELPHGKFIAMAGVAHAAQYDAAEEFLARAMPFWRDASLATKNEAELTTPPDAF